MKLHDFSQNFMGNRKIIQIFTKKYIPGVKIVFSETGYGEICGIFTKKKNFSQNYQFTRTSMGNMKKNIY